MKAIDRKPGDSFARWSLRGLPGKKIPRTAIIGDADLAGFEIMTEAVRATAWSAASAGRSTIASRRRWKTGGLADKVER